jgi:pyruvate kinase
MQKRTKIIATLSDKNCIPEFITNMVKEGMNVIRLNTAHMDRKIAENMVRNIRNVSDKIAILIDTKGPEIRTTAATERIPVTFGDKLIFKGDPKGVTTRECIYVNYPDFVKDIPAGSRIMIDDGNVELIVIEKDAEKLLCEVKNVGFIDGRKSINIPSVHVKLPSLSEKDKDFINFAIDEDIEFIAHSFVRNKEDVLAVQEILDTRESRIKIIAKIENQAGVDNIDEILDHAYGVMVARGDLAVEIPQERIPVIQKIIVEKCIARRKPVIIATQMLHSMIEHPRPTRAEISDVANAVFDGTDAIMLSGETAYGKYPLEAVRTMTQIASEVENIKKPIMETALFQLKHDVTAFLAHTAVKASMDLGTMAIICDTQDGGSVRALAAYRGKNFIIAQSYDRRTMRELALSYGVKVNYMEMNELYYEFVYPALQTLHQAMNIKPNDRLVVVAGNHGWEPGMSNLEINTMEGLLKKIGKTI